ncbi:MAG: Trm112 family protein [Armatimonadota bacterium]
MINPELRALLVCPVDHGPLEDGENVLVCTQCGRRYPIIDGIPDMVPEEETEVTRD